MCEHGDTVEQRVLVPARLAFEGVDTWKVKPIDRCIAPIVQALNDADIYTVASCCGHGKTHGTIVLADGRDLQIKPFDPADYDTRTRGVVSILWAESVRRGIANEPASVPSPHKDAPDGN